jgi:PhnB protein
MSRINPYLIFNGNCREAMNFYKECLGGELSLQTVGESLLAEQMPPDLQGAILHSALVNGDLTIMGSDMRTEQLVDGNTVQTCVHCGSEEELHSFYAGLSDGGRVVHALADMPWGAKLGTIADKYGKLWLLHYDRSLVNQ